MKKRIVAVIIACLTAVSIAACGTTAPETNTDNTPKTEAPAQQTPTPKEDNQDLESLIAADVEATSAEPQKEEAAETKADVNDSDEVTPEFKELMDSYEAFVDEYCEFMEEYADSDDIAGMMGEYTEYMQKLADYTEKLDEYDEDDMSDADLSYYLEVTNRCNQKLLEVA